MEKAFLKISNDINRIRRADEVDVEAVVRIYSRIHDEEEAGRCSVGWRRGVYPTVRTAREALERGDLFVWDDAGEILASAVINRSQLPAYAGGRWAAELPDERVMVLHTLVVDPARSGGGIGRAFVAFYERYARERGCAACRLDTQLRNRSAMRLYPRLGYREAGRVACDFNGIGGVTLVLFEKEIAPGADR